MKHTKSLLVGGVFAATAMLLAGISATAFAQGLGVGLMAHGKMQMQPGVMGTVSAINGTTLSVTSKAFSGFGQGKNGDQDNDGDNTTTTATTYSVNAANATVTKNGTSSTLSAVSVGDTIFAQGTLSGTNLTATAIFDGMPMHFGPGPKRGPWNGTSTMPGAHPMPQNLIQGNGQPVVGGSVKAVSGSTLTVTTAQGGVTYSIDASTATVVKGGATSTIGSIAVGDNVLIQGSVSGTSVTASSVIDQGVPKTMPLSATSSNGRGPGGFGGFFGALGGMFHKLFGFF